MTSGMADALEQRGFAVTSMTVQTPDGRTWEVDAQSAGGFRLFEINDGRREPEEHNAVHDDVWVAGDLVDYLAAVAGR